MRLFNALFNISKFLFKDVKQKIKTNNILSVLQILKLEAPQGLTLGPIVFSIFSSIFIINQHI